MRIPSAWAWPAALLVVALGCGGTDDQPDAGPPRDAGDPAPHFDVAQGSFRVAEGVHLSEESGPRSYGRLGGAIYGDEPTSFHTEAMREGSCRLLAFDVAQCEPFCDGICVDTNVCEPWPTYASAGRVDLEGLKTPLALAPEAPLNWYNPTEFPIPDDLFDTCASITATAAGAEIDTFTVHARGVETVSPAIPGVNLTLEDGSDFTLEWEPSGCDARVRLTLNAPNQAHGLPYRAILECDGPDSGSLTIPAALVAAFPETAGQAICVLIDCPLSTFARYTRGTASIGDGAVELVVASEVQFGVIHEIGR